MVVVVNGRRSICLITKDNWRTFRRPARRGHKSTGVNGCSAPSSEQRTRRLRLCVSLGLCVPSDRRLTEPSQSVHQRQPSARSAAREFFPILNSIASPRRRDGVQLIDIEAKALPRPFRQRAFALLAVLGALCASTAVLANDRPFQVARTAILEDDDDQTWSFESWVQRYGSVRGLSIEPEYNFGAGRSVQVELGRFVDRNDEQTGQEGEVEFKQLFNYIGSDGWAWGVSAAAGVERTQAEGTVRHLN